MRYLLKIKSWRCVDGVVLELYTIQGQIRMAVALLESYYGQRFIFFNDVHGCNVLHSCFSMLWIKENTLFYAYLHNQHDVDKIINIFKCESPCLHIIWFKT